MNRQDDLYDETPDEAESTRYFLARIRNELYTERVELVADTYTPLDEYKGNA